MRFTLIRREKTPAYTIGDLYLEGVLLMNILEDTDRGLSDNMRVEDILKIKVKDETAIPTGIYKIDMDVVSPKYSNFERYKWAKEIGGKVPRLLNVKGFDGILIHPGNTTSDTSGCLLPGRQSGNRVIDSTESFKWLYQFMLKHKNEGLTIEIR